MLPNIEALSEYVEGNFFFSDYESLQIKMNLIDLENPRP